MLIFKIVGHQLRFKDLLFAQTEILYKKTHRLEDVTLRQERAGRQVSKA
jgi:hypothetical protein